MKFLTTLILLSIFFLSGFSYSVKEPKNAEINFEMIMVRGGRFSPGNKSDRNRLNAGSLTEVKSFYLGKYEITQIQWNAYMKQYYRPDHKYCEDCPVDVDWDEAQEFIKKLNQARNTKYRLPTEAEWEYAARGGECSKGYKYSGSNCLRKVAKNTEQKRGDYLPYPVGETKANELGIYDMNGNVKEWCFDNYKCYCKDSLREDDSHGRVIRGHAFFGVSNRKYSRLTRRSWDYHDGGAFHVGFRLAMDGD